MADYEVGVGDTAPPWVVALGDIFGDNPSLVGDETITLSMVPVDGGDALTITGTFSVLDADEVRYDPAAGDFTTPGLYLARWKVNGIETFPSRSPLLVEVFA